MENKILIIEEKIYMDFFLGKGIIKRELDLIGRKKTEGDVFVEQNKAQAFLCMFKIRFGLIEIPSPIKGFACFSVVGKSLFDNSTITAIAYKLITQEMNISYDQLDMLLDLLESEKKFVLQNGKKYKQD